MRGRQRRVFAPLAIARYRAWLAPMSQASNVAAGAWMSQTSEGTDGSVGKE